MRVRINNHINRICLIYLFIFIASPHPLSALIFDRRDRPVPELSYFVYPVAGQVPGVQSFYGAGFTVSAIGGSDIDITGINLRGDAEHFDDGDFNLNLLAVLDVPLFTKRITFSYIYVDIDNGAWPEGERGIESDPESTYYLLGSKITSWIAELSVNIFDNQLEAYYAAIEGSIEPYGVIDPNDRFYTAEEKEIIEAPSAYRWGIYLDDTDDRRDPRIGYRFQYEKWGVPASRGENSAFYQQDYNFTVFIPVLPNRAGVLVLNRFLGTSTVTNEGTIDQDQYTCNDSLIPGCQAVLDELYNRQVEEAKNGKATSLGGTNRLRGYRTNRFFDSYTDFRGIEFRWYLLETQDAFNFIIEKGVFAGLQLAAFYEEGTVAPAFGELWNTTKTSYGLGVRAIFNTAVIRCDVGFSEEGSETTFFVGYPF